MRREVQKGADLREAYTKNPALGDLDTVTEVCVGLEWPCNADGAADLLLLHRTSRIT